MSGYTSGNKAPTLMAQAPNRKGNISKDPAKLTGGVTSITRPVWSAMNHRIPHTFQIGFRNGKITIFENKRADNSAHKLTLL